MNKHKILIADDNVSVGNMMARYFQMQGFSVLTVRNGQDAVIVEETNRPDLIILDVEMPVMNGLEACKIIREKRTGLDHVPIIFLSGQISEDSITAGLELGADDYVRKPFEPLELLIRTKNLLKIKDSLSKVVLLENMVFALVKSIESRDSYTAGHSRRVAQIAANIGKAAGLSGKEMDILAKSSFLHDIGKIGIPDQILNKQGKLTEEEFADIKAHPGKGEEICQNIRLDPQVLDIIRCHHEKMDGSGYPDGLKGKAINRLVKIITVADIFDALTTTRPYRAAMSNKEALAILKQEVKEGKLDPVLVNTLENIVPVDKTIGADNLIT